MLVQVPRRGYRAGAGLHPVSPAAPSAGTAAARWRWPRRAPAGRTGLLSCRWCGVAEAHFRCGACGSDRLRAVAVGAGRTAEEIGRAFPGVPVITSSGQKVRDRVARRAGAGDRDSRRRAVRRRRLRRGLAARRCGDARPARTCGPPRRPSDAGWRRPRWSGRRRAGAGWSSARTPRCPLVQALIRWDPAGHAAAELAARRELGFPPAVAMASIEGDGVGGAAGARPARRARRTAEVLGPGGARRSRPRSAAHVRRPAPRPRQRPTPARTTAPRSACGHSSEHRNRNARR